MLMATHLINRLPSRVLGWKSPFELLYNKAPDYNMLRVFGCLVYFAKVGNHSEKFDPRGEKGVFLGYSVGQKVISFST